MRVTLDLPDEAYDAARAIAREQKQSLGSAVSELILRSAERTQIRMSDYGFPTFRCLRPVGAEDVRAMDEES